MANTLIISDLHAPFQHPDALKFLAELKREYKPNKVISVGDEVDWHSVSFHPVDPDGHSPGRELKEARQVMRKLQKLFPRMTILTSNHGARPFRKAFAAGLPKAVLRTYNEILQVDRGWRWVDELLLDGVYYCHGEGGDALKRSQAMGVNVVQGHWHEKAYVQHWNAPRDVQRWAAQVGCLMDPKNYAAAYSKTLIKKPVLGTLVLVGGRPVYHRL